MAEEIICDRLCSLENSYFEYLEQLNDLSENKINHIIEGSKKLEHDHNWDCLIEDKDWTKIKKLFVKLWNMAQNIHLVVLVVK